MAVLHVKVEPRCKLCRHSRKEDINALLEQRSLRRADEDGNRVNLKYVLARFAEWGVENPTAENVKVHVQKHIEFVEDSVQVQALAAGQAKAKALARNAASHVDVDENLRWIVSVGRAEIEERISQGQRSGITTDHILKATSELTRRAHNEAQHELLGALVGGIGHALSEGKQVKELPDAEVIEIEPVEEQ